MYYPLLLNLKQKHVAIIGAGQVGKRKLFSLLPCGPSSIALYDPCLQGAVLDAFCAEVKEFQNQYIQKKYDNHRHITNADCTPKNTDAGKNPLPTTPKNIAGQSSIADQSSIAGQPSIFSQPFTSGISLDAPVTHISYHTHEFALEEDKSIDLLFAATNNRKTNEQLASFCRENNILCNIADDEGESDFIVPAAIRREGLTITIASNGQSPALTRKIKCDIERWLGNKYSALSLFMGRLRPYVLALNNSPEENARLFRNLIHSELAAHLENNNMKAATTELLALLPKTLHGNIGELLYDI